VTGNDQGHDLAGELKVGHRQSMFAVARMHDPSEYIRRIDPVSPPARRELDDELSQGREHLCKLEVARVLRNDLKMRRDRCIVRAEDRSQDDLEDHPAQVSRYVDTRAALRRIFPLLEQFGIGSDHRADLGVDGLVRKGGLNHAPLTDPKFTVARNEIVAEQHRNALDRVTLANIVLPIFEQHVLDIGRSRDHVNAIAVNRGAVNIPVALETIAHPAQ
jgi:hypothetical protein